MSNPNAMELARLDREIVKLRNALRTACEGWNEARSGTDKEAEQTIQRFLKLADGES